MRITPSGEKIITQTSDKTRLVTLEVMLTISTLTKVLVGVAEGVAALATTMTQEEIVSIDIIVAGRRNKVQRRMTLTTMMMSRNSDPGPIRIHMAGVAAGEEVVEVAITTITVRLLTTLHPTTTTSRMAGTLSKWMHMAIM